MVNVIAGDSDTKFIAQPKLRGVAGEKMESNVGQKVPIVNSTFQPIAAGGVGTQPIVNYTLTDIGIIIKITPRIHHVEKEVTLEVELAISSIAGEAMAGIPIIANREIKNTIRLKDGQTNLLAGLLRDEERRSLGGIVGLKDLPVIGSLFSSTQTTIEQTDVIMTITPHILRSLELSDEDMKPLWVDPESLSGVTGAGGAGQEMREEALAADAQAAPDERAGSGVYLAPESFEAPRDREFRINVELASEKEIGNMSLVLAFDPQVLRLKDVLEGGGLRQMGEKVPFLKNVSGGTCTIGVSAPGGGRGFKGSGVVAVLVFTSVNPGETNVTITNASAASLTGQPVALETGGASVLIR
jgi:general secretion pathway protein D